MYLICISTARPAAFSSKDCLTWYPGDVLLPASWLAAKLTWCKVYRIQNPAMVY
jgi:hypothetical protein